MIMATLSERVLTFCETHPGWHGSAEVSQGIKAGGAATFNALMHLETQGKIGAGYTNAGSRIFRALKPADGHLVILSTAQVQILRMAATELLLDRISDLTPVERESMHGALTVLQGTGVPN